MQTCFQLVKIKFNDFSYPVLSSFAQHFSLGPSNQIEICFKAIYRVKRNVKCFSLNIDSSPASFTPKTEKHFNCSPTRKL